MILCSPVKSLLHHPAGCKLDIYLSIQPYNDFFGMISACGFIPMIDSSCTQNRRSSQLHLEKDHRLTGNITTTTHTKNIVLCGALCLATPTCQSCQYHTASATCQTNSETWVNGFNLESAPGWTFISSETCWKFVVSAWWQSKINNDIILGDFAFGHYCF